MTAMQDIESRNKHVAEELMRLSNIMANDDYLAQAVAELFAWRSKVKSRGTVLEPGESIKSLISKGRR